MAKITVKFVTDFGHETEITADIDEVMQDVAEYLASDQLLFGLGFSPKREDGEKNENQ